LEQSLIFKPLEQIQTEKPKEISEKEKRHIQYIEFQKMQQEIFKELYSFTLKAFKGDAPSINSTVIESAKVVLNTNLNELVCF